jgi:5-methylcytosine-specific restriction endonuclease McrA
VTAVIVLNADGTAIDVASVKRAIGYIIRGKAEIVESVGDVVFRSPKNETVVAVPRVVKFIEQVEYETYVGEMSWSRGRMLARDCYTCAYCGEWGNTVDHILPRSRGGKDTWRNTITSCQQCNNKKDNRTPEEAGMPLLFEPKPVLRAETIMLEMAATGADLEALGITSVVWESVPA